MQYQLKHCCGCKACENICPKGCLKIITSHKNHFLFEIDKKECVDCGKCFSICPMRRGKLRTPVKAVIAFSKISEIARNSSSGGVAASIYQYCMNNQIACIGVHFDSKYNLLYDFVQSKNDIFRTVGSKYVYSDMNIIYQKIENKLKKKEQVVFIGLPCHVSGLKNYCYEKGISLNDLYTIDIVCHGVPMPNVFKRHMQKIVGNSIRFSDIYFRKKDNPYGLTIERDKQIIYRKSRYRDEYMLSFLLGHYTEGCYRCPYATQKRCGDISIKDHCSTENGTRIKGYIIYNASDVLINSKKGSDFFHAVSRNLCIQETFVDEVVAADLILQHPAPRPKFYYLFNKLEKWIGFERAVRCIYGGKIVCGKNLEKKKQNDFNKYWDFFNMMNYWVKAKQQGKNFSFYLESKGYYRIAVYGMGYIGETFIEELKETNIEIIYAIDRNTDISNPSIKVVLPNEILEEVDAVIVTAITSFDVIKENISHKLDCPIISLKDIIYEIYN